MLPSGKRSLSKEDIKAADTDEKVSNIRVESMQRIAGTDARLAGNLTRAVEPAARSALQESLLEHDSDLDEEMLFT